MVPILHIEIWPQNSVYHSIRVAFIATLDTQHAPREYRLSSGPRVNIGVARVKLARGVLLECVNLVLVDLIETRILIRTPLLLNWTLADVMGFYFEILFIYKRPGNRFQPQEQPLMFE